MPKNMGTIDRWIRVALGVALLALVVLGPKTTWGYLGLLPLFTGIFGYCPLYQLLGWSTKYRGYRAPA